MNLGVEPKVIVLALIVMAGLIYYFTSGSETPAGSGSQTAASPAIVRPVVSPSMAGRLAAARRANTLHNDRQTLKLVPVDGSRGDIDPTLRLGLLERVKSVPAATGLRNLFEAGGVALAQNLPPVPKNAPKIAPGPLPPPVSTGPVTPPPVAFSIPLKYYGFVRPNGRTLDGNRGFFMDGDNILIGAEGDVLEKKFLIVALTPNTARLEDTEAKQGQDLQVTPEAPPAQ